MLSIKNIWTIARYEVKTLLRSWFFRIFSGLVLIVLTFFNIVIFAQAFATMPWQSRGIPSSMPYFNLILLNVAQAVIAIFLASDFLKRDRKSNTTEVIYMRSMSNADYIIGKSIGLFYVFLGLNVLLLLISAIVQIIFADVVFQPMLYIYYLLLISIPTLIFIFGLSFLVMSLVKNQAVTFLLLLGYFAVSMIVLNFRFNSTFDAVAMFLPLAYSDFVGFSDLPSILMQRLAYFSLGLGFIFLSVLLFKRLPQSKPMQTISAILAFVLITTGSVLFLSYYAQARSGEKLRASMIELSDHYIDQPVATVLSYDINLQHENNTIRVAAVLELQNDHKTPLSSLTFTLNPGLTVENLEVDGQAIEFTRDLHVLNVKTALAGDERRELSIQYSGSIDNRAFYLATSRDERNQMNELELYKLGKDHSFIEPDYVLLTSEANWYPVPGVPAGSALVTTRQKNFAEYRLHVKTNSDLLPICQGKSRQTDEGFEFKPEVPLTQISLVIGDYKRRSIEVDSVMYNLYTHNRHNHFFQHITAISDTLAPMIRELKNDYELKTNVNYPFKSFSLIEVPIHFKTYKKPLSLHQDWIQPMQVFVPENGAPVGALDFKGQLDRSMDRMQDRNETISETEMQYQVVRRFVEAELFGTTPGRFFGRGPGQQEDGLFVIFPNFYHFKNALVSTELPILDAALEAFLKDKVETMPFNPARFRNAITDEEKANIALKDHSLQDILADPANADKATVVLKMKSAYLFRYLESKVGIEELAAFLSGILEKYNFTSLSAEELIAKMQSEFGINLQEELQQWYAQKDVPGFYFTDVRNYKILDGDRIRYQVLMNVYNPEPVGGVVVLDFFLMGGGGGRGGGFGRFNFGATEYQRAVYMEPGQTKRIGFVLDDQPRAMTINTLVSRNLPSQDMRRFEDFEENKNAQGIDGITILPEPPKLQMDDEIIVDNEDEGFKVETVQQQSTLKKLFNIKSDDEDEYIPFSPWRGPDNWRKGINAIFYGDFVHSAHFVRTGGGEKKVTWETELERGGQYEVYIYVENLPFRGRGRGRGPGGRGGGDFVKSFHYKIYHDDGEEEVEWDPESAEGWNYLGTYYFSSGVAKVELTNQSEGRIVIADAVKWVKK